jgi:hypothetical protein
VAKDRTETVALAPESDTASAEYERDFYSWCFEQARLVREGRWAGVDRENVAEEIESFGREQFAKLRSAIRGLLIHMLKWDCQAERRSRSWALSIRSQRMSLQHVMDGNPGLKPRIGQAIEEAHARARLEAALETGLAENVFPEQCPYSWEDITVREFVWPDDQR